MPFLHMLVTASGLAQMGTYLNTKVMLVVMLLLECDRNEGLAMHNHSACASVSVRVEECVAEACLFYDQAHTF
jgi:hypothetical protein